MEPRKGLRMSKVPIGVKYFLTECGGVARVTNGVTLHSLQRDGTWVPNQYKMSMFYDGIDDYREISEKDVNTIIKSGFGSVKY